MEAHRSPLPGCGPQMRPLCEGPPHGRPPVPRRGLQGGEGPPVSTRGGKVRKLRRISWGAGRCLCCQEGGPLGRQGVEVTTPRVQGEEDRGGRRVSRGQVARGRDPGRPGGFWRGGGRARVRARPRGDGGVGRGRIRQNVLFFFLFPFVLFALSFAFSGGYGEKESLGHPHYDGLTVQG